MYTQILCWILLLAYLAFVIFIFIGGGFITKLLFNSDPNQLRSIGINTETEINIGKMTIILFWLVFIPLTIVPIVLFAGYGKYI
jgi:hypothetical protein